MTQAPIALTCGEPAGIGPETAQAAWNTLKGELPVLWVGDPRHLPLPLPWREVSEVAEAVEIAYDALPVWPVPMAGRVEKGVADPRNAPGVIAAIEEGVRLTQSGAARALCTAPIHKAALQDGAGFAFPGHTEFLAHLAGVRDVTM
ncbi:MAG: 4-hydroxythreonine-4-phosphate dehydrogenase PdxA, partial [Pseudomonadota bacterium]